MARVSTALTLLGTLLACAFLWPAGLNVLPEAAARPAEAAAEPKNDPMRPPMVLRAAATPAAANGTGAAPAPAPAHLLPVLQGTRRSAQGTWLALLDGRWRAVGERHGEAVVTAVRPTEVQLTAGGQGLTVKLQAFQSQTNGITPGNKQDRP